MKNKPSDTLKFLKTTAIGGLLFLLPVAAVAGLFAYLYRAIVVVHEHLKPWIPLGSATGFLLLFSLVTVVLLAACFLAGLMAQRAIGVHFSGTIEKRLMKLMPKYGIYKDLLAGTIGGSENVPSLRPVVVKRDGALVFGFQADQLTNGLVVVYLPGAPDPWNGSVAMIPSENVQSVELRFTGLVEICERLGRDASRHLTPTGWTTHAPAGPPKASMMPPFSDVER